MDDAKFRIDEPGSDDARATFLRDHASDAEALREKEAKRRARKQKGEEEDPRAAGDLLDGIEGATGEEEG